MLSSNINFISNSSILKYQKLYSVAHHILESNKELMEDPVFSKT